MPSYLWHDRHVVPLLKVDNGRDPEADGVQLMKPMPNLDTLLERAMRKGIFGTKMRSVIKLPSSNGIAAVVAQQFEVAEHIAQFGLTPIIEPEVLISSPDKIGAETILRDEIGKRLEALPDGVKVMLKLTIPSIPDLYQSLVEHRNVMRVLALSGGYSRGDACEKLRQNKGMIASFSRELVEDIRIRMTDMEFDQALSCSVNEIYGASITKN